MALDRDPWGSRLIRERVTHAQGTAAGRAAGTASEACPSMTISVPIDRRRYAVALPRDPVCTGCGHGASLHPQRDVACLVCDQRADLGLRGPFCAGYRSDRFEVTRASTS